MTRNTPRNSPRKPGSKAKITDKTAPRPGPATLATSADRHILYQEAVQCVEAEIDFVDENFRNIRKRKAVLLREDFCGTANTSCEWVRRRPTNVAIGVDLDRPTLDWGIAHNIAKLSKSQRERITLNQANVLDEPNPKAKPFDIILAMNFSYWCLKNRETLLRYFTLAHRALADDGILFLDHYGGPDAIRELKERRPVGRKGSKKAFTYIWDQAEFNSITNECLCHIHFKLSDGSRLDKAFSYDWRVWSVPELRDILAEAGFSKTTVYWEGDDKNGGGDGVFSASETGEACPSFIVYIAAEK